MKGNLRTNEKDSVPEVASGSLNVGLFHQTDIVPCRSSERLAVYLGKEIDGYQ